LMVCIDLFGGQSEIELPLSVMTGPIVSFTAIETVASELVSAGDEPSPVSVTVNVKLSGPL
jgi:hypothetical protein